MRNRVFWNSPHTKRIVSLSALGLTALAFAGCGGGGGGSNNNGGGGGGGSYSITGTVKDNTTSHAPVAGALVAISGTSLTTHTDSAGHFSFASVPSTATAFTVGNPNTALYFSYANYNGALYDILNCSFPLPTLHTGTNTVSEVDLLYSGNNAPPPPPPSGCP